MEELKIDAETASQEVERWLDSRKMSESKRDHHKESIESLETAVSEGNLIINEDGSINQKLVFPLESEGGRTELDSLSYAPRLRYKDVKRHLKGVKNDDAMGMVHAHISGLTNQPLAIVDSLEMSDLNIARQIASLFL